MKMINKKVIDLYIFFVQKRPCLLRYGSLKDIFAFFFEEEVKSTRNVCESFIPLTRLANNMVEPLVSRAFCSFTLCGTVSKHTSCVALDRRKEPEVTCFISCRLPE